MKIQKSNKKSFLKKIFIKICRLLNFEIIDQSNFTIPTLKKRLDENLSSPGRKSITLPMGEIKITRQINSLNIIFRFCTNVKMLTQSKQRLFEEEKNQYTLRSLNSILKSIQIAKNNFKYLDIKSFQNRLIESCNLKEQVQIISNLMRELIHSHNIYENDNIEKAISIIISTQGQIKIRELLKQIHVTERTFERNFKSYVGLSPKQFAKIIQFQSSLKQLTEAKFQKLTDIGLDSGFTDQSHFIRTFKSYTGQTPSFYYANL